MNDVDPNIPTPENDQPTQLEIHLPEFEAKDADATVLDAPAINLDSGATVIAKRPTLPDASQVEPTVVALTPLEDLSSQATVGVKRPEIPAVEVPAPAEIPAVPQPIELPEISASVDVPEIPVEVAESAVMESAGEMATIIAVRPDLPAEIAKPADVIEGAVDDLQAIVEEETLPPSVEVSAEPLQAIESTPEPVKVNDVYAFIGESGSSDIPRPAMPDLPPMPDAPPPALPAIPPPPPPSYTPSAGTPSATGKDRGIALILELVAGFFGFLGIGWLYAGKTTEGVLLLVGYFVFNGIMICVDIATLKFTGGFTLCCHIPLNIAALAVSAYYLHQYTKTSPDFVS